MLWRRGGLCDLTGFSDIDFEPVASKLDLCRDGACAVAYALLLQDIQQSFAQAFWPVMSAGSFRLIGAYARVISAPTQCIIRARFLTGCIALQFAHARGVEEHYTSRVDVESF